MRHVICCDRGVCSLQQVKVRHVLEVSGVVVAAFLLR